MLRPPGERVSRPAAIWEWKGDCTKHRLQRAGVNLGAHVLLRDVHSLATRRTHEGVVVHRSGDNGPALSGEPRKIERQVQQIVDVQHVRPHRIERVRQLFVDAGRTVRLLEGAKLPVVDDFDDGETVDRAPAQRAVGRRRIVFGREDEDVVPRRLLASELESVNLRPGTMARKKVVDGVQDSHAGYRPASRSAASCWLRCTHSATPGVDGASRRASPHMRAAAW